MRARTFGILLLLVAAGFVLWPKGRDLPARPTERLDPDELVATISTGEAVNLDAHLAPGKWTLVEFYADW